MREHMRELSIIIPAYNAQDYIRSCLEHIRTIGLFADEKIEIIVIDDGSTDQTSKILQEYAKEEPGLIVIRQHNAGVSVARNTGMQKATGRYMMFLDADDYLKEENWRYIAQELKGQREFVAFSYFTLFADGKVQEERFGIEQEICTDLETVQRYAYASSRLNACWAKLFLREIIEEQDLKFIPGMKIGEDAIFVMEYLKYVREVAMIERPVLYYRQVEASAMHQSDILKKLGLFQILYQYRKKNVSEQDVIYADMCREHFSVLTDLMLQGAGCQNKKQLRKVYKEFLEHATVQQILEEQQVKKIHPIYKKFEYDWMKKKKIGILIAYFRLKARKARG